MRAGGYGGGGGGGNGRRVAWKGARGVRVSAALLRVRVSAALLEGFPLRSHALGMSPSGLTSAHTPSSHEFFTKGAGTLLW